jgi:hypothetical protein
VATLELEELSTWVQGLVHNCHYDGAWWCMEGMCWQLDASFGLSNFRAVVN